MGTQKRLNETVLLSTQNTFKLMVKKIVTFYAHKISLSGSMRMSLFLTKSAENLENNDKVTENTMQLHRQIQKIL